MRRRVIFLELKTRLGIAAVFLVLLLTLPIGVTVYVLPSVKASIRTVDGDPSDWIGIPGGDNTYTVSNGEGIWRDMAFDDTGNGSYIYPNATHLYPLIADSAGAPWTAVPGPTEALAYTDKFGGTAIEPYWYKHGGMVDLREFRVTGDNSNLYLMLRFENMGSQEIAVEWNKDIHETTGPNWQYANATGFGKILAQVYIDQDRVLGSGRTNATMFGNFLIAPEAAWEAVIDIAGDPYSRYPYGDGYGLPRVEFANGTIHVLNDTVASANPLQPQKAVYIQANCDIYPSAIELKVPYNVIGDPRGKTWRFVVVVGGYDEGRWRQVWSTSLAQLMGWPPFFRFVGGEGMDPPDMGLDPNIIDMAFTSSQAEQEALLISFQTTGQLVQINAYQDIEFDVGPVTPPEYTQVLLVNETVGINRMFEPVDYYMTFDDGQCLNASKEIRVTTIDDTEVPSQVYNITTYGSGYVKSANVVFQANVTAYSSATYRIYYGNPNATTPTYATGLLAEATDTNITVWNTHYKASFVKEDPTWYDIPDYINYLYYNPYNATENLARADWPRILMTIINVPPYWFGPFPGGKPVEGTNVTITERGPIFIEVRAELGEWPPVQLTGVNSFVKTYRFYARIPWFLFSIHFNLTGANYGHIQSESYLSKTALPYATYRTKTGLLKTFGIAPSQGDFLDWDGTWIDAETTNTTDNPVGIGFIAMNGTDPPYTGFRSDQYGIAPFQSGAFLEARQNLAILLHQGNYIVTEQAYKMISHPLTIYVGPDTVPPVADAGSNQSVYQGMTVTFNASGSTDNVGIVSYVWTFTDVTPKTLTGINSAYTFYNVGNFEVTLNVTDVGGNWDTDTMWVNVSADDINPSINPPSHYPETPDEWKNVTVSVNVTDGESGVKNVTLSYTINNGTSWTDLPMNYNKTTGLYEVAILSQSYCTWVKYKIIAYDKAGNQAINDKAGQYYVYHVIPEFPTWTSILLILCVFAGVLVILSRKMQNQKLYTNGT